MIDNSQPLPAATDVCNTYLGSAPGLLQNLNTAHFSSLSVTLYLFLLAFFVCLFGFFKAASFEIGMKKYIQEYAHVEDFSLAFPIQVKPAFPLYKCLFHLLKISDLNSHFIGISQKPVSTQMVMISQNSELLIKQSEIFFLTTLFLSS